MSEEKVEQAGQTFAMRANQYDSETNWVAAQKLLAPLVPERAMNADASVTDFLDVCSGTGQLAKLAARKGWKPVALDRSKEMLSNMEGGDVLCVVGDALPLPFTGNAFEVVAMRQALHYFNTATMLLEMARVAKNEIRLGHITTHSEEDVDLWESYFSVASPGRLRVFTPNFIANAAKEVGLDVVDTLVIESREKFFGPIKHLGPDTAKQLLDNFLAGPPRIVERYFSSSSTTQNDPEMRLRWEFSTIKV